MFAKEFNIKFSIKNKKNILIAKSNKSKVCVLKRNINSDYYFISQEKTNIPQNNLSPLKKVNKYKIDDNDWSTILSFSNIYRNNCTNFVGLCKLLNICGNLLNPEIF